MRTSSPAYAPPEYMGRSETHDAREGFSSHSLNSGELLSVRIPWPLNVPRMLLEADVPNGHAVASLMSRRGAQTYVHAFGENRSYLLEIGSSEFEQHPDELYVLLVGIDDHTDVGIHSVQFPESSGHNAR
jgi:hypothetical protein